MELMNLRSVGALRLNKSLKVDKENNTIRGVVGMQANVEALGHGCQSDMKTIQKIAELGNSYSHGIRMRFGHPGMSENAEGRQLGRAKNFKVVGDKLVHDAVLMQAAKLSPVFSQDPIAYVMTMASEHPEDIALSAVVRANKVWTFKDGREIDAEDYETLRPMEKDPKNPRRPKDALTPLPVIRPSKFTHMDFVSEGALTHNGLFSAQLEEIFEDTASEFAEQAFLLLDDWRQRYKISLGEIPVKADQVVRRYMMSRAQQDGQEGSKMGLQDEGAELQDQAPGNSTLDLLAAAEAESEGTTEELTATPEGPTENERIAALEAKVAELSAIVDRVVNLTAKNTSNLSVLGDKVRRLDGEPYVQITVPPTQQMSALNGGSAPSESDVRAALKARPDGSTAPSDPAKASLQASQRRAQHGQM